ncbi:MAG: ACP S-malonyltransferase [Thermodesulfobacteriota bacterium]|jgi:[acyl-carrier-protein] S-malonyltransferase|nr:MAG: ACP S-malonyltransferase [Thermodesulfobacteriota bacterium]
MGKIAFIFPGQGTQTVGMGKNLCDNFKEAREVFAEADEALRFKLSSLCFDGSEKELNLTVNTQPAVLTVSTACLRVIEKNLGITPDYMAGHSLGEYSALVGTKAFSFSDGVKAVQKRGQFMQEAVPEGEGGMAAVLGLSRAQVEEVCQEAAQGEVMTPANFNCPGQIVISGATKALGRAIVLAKEKGSKTVVLSVSAPFHSALMEPAAQKLKNYLNDVVITPLGYPVVTNVEAMPNQEASLVKEILIKQVTHPVLWEDSITAMRERGVTTYVEIGPGKVLSGLVKKIDKTATLFNVENTESLKKLEKIWKEIH